MLEAGKVIRDILEYVLITIVVAAIVASVFGVVFVVSSGFHSVINSVPQVQPVQPAAPVQESNVQKTSLFSDILKPEPDLLTLVRDLTRDVQELLRRVDDLSGGCNAPRRKPYGPTTNAVLT